MLSVEVDRMKGVFVMQLLLHLVLCVGEPEAERRTWLEHGSSCPLLHSWRDVPFSTWTFVQGDLVKRTVGLLHDGQVVLATGIVTAWACHRRQNAFRSMWHTGTGATGCIGRA